MHPSEVPEKLYQLNSVMLFRLLFKLWLYFEIEIENVLFFQCSQGHSRRVTPLITSWYVMLIVDDRCYVHI